VVELDSTKKSRFATTAHVTQLKSWKLGEEPEPEVELERQTEDGDTDSEQNEVLKPEWGINEASRRPVRDRRPPGWLQDSEQNV